MRYDFASDSVQVAIEATDRDEAARKFAASERIKGVERMSQLVAHIVMCDGSITIQEDGIPIARVK